MTSEEVITLSVPRAKTEALFIQRVIQAALRAYRNESSAQPQSTPDREVPGVACLKSAPGHDLR